MWFPGTTQIINKKEVHVAGVSNTIMKADAVGRNSHGR